MTHDGLLFKIYEIHNNSSDAGQESNKQYKGMIQFMQALRAVVELHPMIEQGEPFIDGDRYGVTIYMCGKCNVPYPCEDIQAIEKELK